MLFKFLLCFCCVAGMSAGAQNTNGQPKKPFGVKGGVNTNYMSSLRSFDAKNNIGFFAGVFYAPATKSRFGSRSEILFSRQGYDYSSNQQTGTVRLDYLMLPQLFTVNFTRFLQVQAGVQMAILLRGAVDSSASPSSVPNPAKPTDVFARFHFGYAAGLESNPIGGLTIGARYNLFLNLLDNNGGQPAVPAYVPDYSGRLKHGTFQFSVGYRF
ncbi:MAG TPA: outer membrane beta-barrel protein [Flavisolibacter sp.]|nr:outer membrane beta-barrel protein [Flavisolibacter sp.]